MQQTSFIPYLTLNDYLPTTQSGILNNQILDAIERGGNQQRQFAESWAISEIVSVIGDYFDLSLEFKATLPFKFGRKYFAGDRCYIDFPKWIASSGSESEGDEGLISYAVGQCVVKYTDEINKLGGTGYFCNTANSDTTWKPENWTSIGNQYDIYYIAYPYQMFVLNIEETNGTNTRGYYYINDKVCFTDNHVYQCSIETGLPSHSNVEQFYRTYNVPPANSFPGQKGSSQWKDLGEYGFINEPPFHSDPDIYNLMAIGSGDDGEQVQQVVNSVWTLGDNRSPFIIQCVVNLSVWLLTRRIAPEMVPKEIENFKDISYRVLKDIKNGEKGIGVPRIQPIQVGDLSWGSNTKSRNGY